jgi:hypothetical protein
MNKAKLVFAIALMTIAAATYAQGATGNPGTPANTTIAVSLNQSESFTLTTTPASLAIPPSGAASSTITAMLSWSLNVGRNMELDSWFASATGALGNLPASNFSTTAVNAGFGNPGTPGVCNGNGGPVAVGAVAGAACPVLWSYAVTSGTQTGGMGVTWSLLDNSPGNIVPGVYSGTYTVSLNAQ